MKHIGILAHSFEGAALCYRTMCLEGVVRLGPHLHPEITLTGVAMQHMMPAYEAGDYQAVRRMFLHDIDKLAAADADFFVCPDNTAHIALESDGLSFAIPCLHIGEVVAEEAHRGGRRKVGILGTEWTMTGPVYPAAFGRRGIGWAIPETEDRQLIHRVIFDELCLGVFTEEFARCLCADHRPAPARRLRFRCAGLHRNPAVDQRRRVAAANHRFHAAAGAGGG